MAGNSSIKMPLRLVAAAIRSSELPENGHPHAGCELKVAIHCRKTQHERHEMAGRLVSDVRLFCRWRPATLPEALNKYIYIIKALRDLLR
jgi:hypothetical protein